MDALFRPIADLVGASVDQLKVRRSYLGIGPQLTPCTQLIFCLLVAYPLGSLYIRVPSSNPNARHLFSIATAFFFYVPVLNIPDAFAQLLADMLFTYAMARYNTSRNMPWVVFWCVARLVRIPTMTDDCAGCSWDTSPRSAFGERVHVRSHPY